MQVNRLSSLRPCYQGYLERGIPKDMHLVMLNTLVVEQPGNVKGIRYIHYLKKKFNVNIWITQSVCQKVEPNDMELETR